MSIDGITGGYSHPALTPGLRDRVSIDESAGKAIRAPEGGVDDVKAASRRSRALIPSEAPAGTDPALWSVLTSEERSFFARAQPAGPLTYGPTRAGHASARVLLGGRIDLRV